MDGILIDNHSHIYMHPKKELVYERNKDIIIVESGVDLNSNKIVIESSKKYDNIFCSIGLHPTDICKKSQDELKKELDFLENILYNKKNYPKLVALGEIGLDYYWYKDEKSIKKQKETLSKLIELANEYKIPIIFHTRNAEKDIIEFLPKIEVPFILHTYTGKRSILKQILKDYSNSYLSISTIVCKNKNLLDMYKKAGIDINRILTETDTPFLSPIPNTKNEPKNVKYIIPLLSSILEIPEEEILKNIVKNFEEVYKIKLYI